MGRLSPPESLIQATSVSTEHKLGRDEFSVGRKEETEPEVTGVIRGYTSKGYLDFSSSTTAIVFSCLAIVFYLLLGTIVFATWIDGWTFADALYYTVVTFTTVGYGDLSPVTPYQRLFGIFFAIFGILVLGNVALGIVFDHLIKSVQEATKKSSEISKERMMQKLKRPMKVMESLKSTMHTRMKYGKIGKEDGQVASPNDIEEESKTEKDIDISHKVDQRKRCVSIFITNLFLVVIGIIAPAFIIGVIEKWTVVDILYFASITATTIGYGDLSPQKLSTRMIAVFYLPLCITIMAKIFSNIASSFLEKRAQKAEKDFYNRGLTTDDLKAMGIENNGSVSYGEFLEFMLVTMNKVGDKDVKELRDLYNALDTDADGSLTFKDLCSLNEDICHIASESNSNNDEEEGTIMSSRESTPVKAGNVENVVAN